LRHFQLDVRGAKRLAQRHQAIHINRTSTGAPSGVRLIIPRYLEAPRFKLVQNPNPVFQRSDKLTWTDLHYRHGPFGSNRPKPGCELVVGQVSKRLLGSSDSNLQSPKIVK
jgi:hypothetical protein